jgi:predicted SprT family Zn-dependent metalloprotease
MIEPTKTCYGELQRIYDQLNRELFNSVLPGALLTLQREKSTMGYFSPARFANRSGGLADEIAINPEFFAVRPLLEVIQTIGHEMVHQWQLYHGKPGRGRYHNEQWASKMQDIGLMPSSTGKPGGSRTGDRIADYVIKDGPFHRVATKLNEDGPIVTWYDRLVQRTESMTAQQQSSVYDTTGEPEQELNELAVVVAINNPVIQLKPASNTVGKTLGNRLKYVCAGCDTAVWAKPGLTNLGCFDCNLSFSAKTNNDPADHLRSHRAH